MYLESGETIKSEIGPSASTDHYRAEYQAEDDTPAILGKYTRPVLRFTDRRGYLVKYEIYEH